MTDTFEYSGDYEWAEWRTGAMCAVCDMYDSTKTEAIGVRVVSYGPFYTSPHSKIEALPVCEKCATEATNYRTNKMAREINVIRFVKEDTGMHNGEQMLVEAYDKHGVQGVLDLVKSWGAEWGWEECVPCEQVTATYDGVCAVCFTEREDN